MQAGNRRIRIRLQGGGFTLLTVLVLLATVSLAMAAAGPLWADQARRARELELLRTGAAYAEALRSFHAASPGATRQYPQTLADLLLDPRQLGTLRHLRRMYPDPLSPARPWGLVRDDAGGIVGVYSLSADRPIADDPTNGGPVWPKAATSYTEWKFLAEKTR